VVGRRKIEGKTPLKGKIKTIIITRTITTRK